MGIYGGVCDTSWVFWGFLLSLFISPYCVVSLTFNAEDKTFP